MDATNRISKEIANEELNNLILYGNNKIKDVDADGQQSEKDVEERNIVFKGSINIFIKENI